jgi:hypothetical protein
MPVGPIRITQPVTCHCTVCCANQSTGNTEGVFCGVLGFQRPTFISTTWMSLQIRTLPVTLCVLSLCLQTLTFRGNSHSHADCTGDGGIGKYVCMCVIRVRTSVSDYASVHECECECEC